MIERGGSRLGVWYLRRFVRYFECKKVTPKLRTRQIPYQRYYDRIKRISVLEGECNSRRKIGYQPLF